MRSKFSTIFIYCLTVILIFSALPCFARDTSDSDSSRAEAIFSDILSHHGASTEKSSVQKLIDGKFSESPASGEEWYIYALAQYSDYDFSKYEASLISYLAENTVRSASSRLKYALCLAAVGSKHEYIQNTVNDSIGKQGLMSWVFGLHLLNNGYQSSDYSSSDIVSKLLTMQCSDGGWAITGQYGDVDATAMTVQALAPFYDKDENVKAAIDKAVSLLSEKQLEDGDFLSYGVANPESGVQVLIALSSLGIDCLSDTRFIKNGNSVFDGIEKFSLADNSFSHTYEGDSNPNATIQVFCGMVAYIRMINGKAPFYVIDITENTPNDPTPTPPENNNGSSDENSGAGSDKESGNPDPKEPESNSTSDSADPIRYKVWIIAVIILTGAIVSLILFLKKRRNIKNFIAVLLAVALLIGIVYFTEIKSPEDYYNGDDETKENIIGSVTLTIRCDSVAGEAEHIPSDGIILDTTVFDIEDGDTVYSILVEAAKKYKIHFENDGSEKMVYISGISYIYEFDFGDLSGWTYTVNGQRSSVGAGEYKLSDGDAILWEYTLTLGAVGE